jgi:hypothetical protein
MGMMDAWVIAKMHFWQYCYCYCYCYSIPISSAIANVIAIAIPIAIDLDNAISSVKLPYPSHGWL